jgi:hypothetical protein
MTLTKTSLNVSLPSRFVNAREKLSYACSSSFRLATQFTDYHEKGMWLRTYPVQVPVRVRNAECN